jgi:hypothetical protein
MDWVSLLINKKRYSEVCKYYEDKVLKKNGNVRMIPISYGKHDFVFKCSMQVQKDLVESFKGK